MLGLQISQSKRDVMQLYQSLGGEVSIYVNTLEYTELLSGLILIGHMEVRYSLLYYVLLLLGVNA